jgi:hypothetical protein
MEISPDIIYTNERYLSIVGNIGDSDQFRGTKSSLFQSFFKCFVVGFKSSWFCLKKIHVQWINSCSKCKRTRIKEKVSKRSKNEEISE